MAEVLVLYYYYSSSYGHVEKLAHEIAAGAREAGASADVKRVPELLSPAAAKAANYKFDQTTSPSTTHRRRHGHGLRQDFVPNGKLPPPGSRPMGEGSPPGQGRRRLRVVGNAARRLGDDAVHHHHQPAPLRHDGGRTELRVRRPDEVDEITGGAPYGAATIAGLDAQRQPSENELAGARYQLRAIAETAAKLHD